MCTCMIAGRNASAGGRVIFAANDDWDHVAGVMTHVCGAAHAPGDTRLLTGGQRIPQPEETFGYSYTACSYSIGTLDRSWAGGMNDRGVAAAGTGVDANKFREMRPLWENRGCALEPDDIPLLILERGRSARDAVRMVADLIMEYGMRPSQAPGSPGTSSATFSVADAREGWVLETAPGRCFVAVRVPDDMVSVRVNCFGTHDADLTDAENTIASPGLTELAQACGFPSPDGRHFDFAAAFGAETSPTEWGPERDPMNRRRVWRAMNLISGEEGPEEELRYAVRPGKPLVPEDLMRVLSDVYDGTPYDLGNVPESGRFHDPFAEGMPDYALCRRGTVSSIVSEFAGQAGDSVLWTALGTPRMVPYIPIYADIRHLPAFMEGNRAEADERSFYYEMKKLCVCTEYCYERNILLTGRRKEELEKEMRERLLLERAELCAAAGEERRGLRARFTEEHLRTALDACRKTCGALLEGY